MRIFLSIFPNMECACFSDLIKNSSYYQIGTYLHVSRIPFFLPPLFLEGCMISTLTSYLLGSALFSSDIDSTPYFVPK